MQEKLPVPPLESIQLLTQDVGSVFQGKMNSVVVALRNALIAFNAQIDAAETASQQVEPAPEDVALEGTNNTYKMTPLRSAQLIEKLLTDATADEAEALAGTSDKLITALLLDLVLEWRLGTAGNLGTAAQKDAVANSLDLTPGRLLALGASGPQLGADVFHRGNSVGVVSEVDGIPTGAIVQRGGGLTGKFTRLLDGTMFCFRRELTGSSPDIPFGAIFMSSTMTRSTPATFVDAPGTSGDAPQKFVSVVGPRSAPWWVVNQDGQAPATNEWAFRVASSQSQSGQVVLVDLFAIGRWSKKDIEV